MSMVVQKVNIAVLRLLSLEWLVCKLDSWLAYGELNSCYYSTDEGT